MSGPMVLCQLWMGGVSKYYFIWKYNFYILFLIFTTKLRIYFDLVRTVYDRKFYNECFS